jgi:hypothetical protein
MNKHIYSILIAIALAIFLLNPLTVLSTSGQSKVYSDAQRRLEVLGLVAQPLNLTVSEIAAMPPTSVQATIYCVDFPNQVVETGNWTGVKLGFLLETAGVLSSATKIAFFASDGYSTDLLLETAMEPEIILAFEKDGAPLNETLRLVVPGRWGYKWIAHLTKIEAVDFDFKGKWESAGYSDDGISGPIVSIITEFSNLNKSQLNVTTVSPPSSTPNPPPSNSSNTLASQVTPIPMPETPEPNSQKPEPSQTVSITITSVVLVTLTGVVLLRYLRKR